FDIAIVIASTFARDGQNNNRGTEEGTSSDTSSVRQKFFDPPRQ
ncbi:23620_t:CDS:2, partial [Gigaspora margarita]